MCAYEDLVDFVKPGDRVQIVGIYRAVGLRINTNMRTMKNVYKTYIDVIGYSVSDKARYSNDLLQEPVSDDQLMADDDHQEMDEAINQEHDVAYTEEQINKFKELSKNPQLYDLLIDAFAPSIWENHDVKKGILCQLFGGCSKSF